MNVEHLQNESSNIMFVKIYQLTKQRKAVIMLPGCISLIFFSISKFHKKMRLILRFS